MKTFCVRCLKYFVLLVAASLSTDTVFAAESATKRDPRPGRDGAASVQEMIDSRTDVWGDAAMQQPNGASYGFFKDLLPPLRWVNAEFHHYPIVLSAPRAAQKVRLISNGSAVNARGNRPRAWYDQGTPIRFSIGDKAEVFGEDLSRLDEPRYLDGYLPVVQLSYRGDDARYEEEVFAPVDDFSAAHGAALVRFSLAKDG